jgi:predicted dehydrogenase
MSNQAFTFAILGAGGRGGAISDWLHYHPEAGRVVAVAEPQAERREKIAKLHKIKPELQFESWEPLLAKPKLADVIVNTTMDKMHVHAAIPALNKGYHMLLEKPMATTLEDCVAIDEARRKNKRIVSVCHGMRYHVISQEVKKLLDSGVIGKLMTFDLLEAVEHIHQSHSFVRGNWGNEGRSTFMLMAKSCHDVDFLAFLIGKPCERVSSFGSLSYFTKENMPKGAPLRCVDGCPADAECVYSTNKVYTGPNAHWGAGHAGLSGKPYEEQIKILKTSPYGRCVYQCDNDVVDHQVVNFEFAGGITGTFTMTAFTNFGGRHMRFHGTHGYIEADNENNTIDIRRFSDNKHDHIVIPPQHGGLGGADHNIMVNLIQALRTNDPEHVLTTTAESLASHKIAFAAELSRREKRMVELAELEAKQKKR